MDDSTVGHEISKSVSSRELARTGERCVLGESGWEIELEHITRYAACASAVRAKNVLDVACGSGYGSAMMAADAASVLGVDIDEAAVTYASRHHRVPGLSFTKGSVDSLPVDDSSIDVVVSFETIEHVDRETQDAFIAEAKRALRSDGLFIVSCPDRAVTEASGGDNPYHLHEMYRDEFRSRLESAFPQVDFYLQYQGVYSEIAPEGSSADTRVSGGLPAKTTYPYMVAVCSSGPTPSIAMVRRAPVDFVQGARERYEASAYRRLTEPVRELRGRLRSALARLRSRA